MPKKPEPAKTKTYVTIGMDAEELEAINGVMAFYRCSQSAAVRLLIRNGAENTPMEIRPRNGE